MISLKVVGLAIVVDEDVLVNGLSTVVEVSDEGRTDGINVGALGLICHSDADTADQTLRDLVLEDIVGTKVQVVLAIAGDGGGSPHGLVRPFHVVGGEDVGMLGPVDQVRRREGIHVSLLLIVVRVRREDPVLAVVVLIVGVGVPALDDGVAGFRCGEVGHGLLSRRRCGCGNLGHGEAKGHLLESLGSHDARDWYVPRMSMRVCVWACATTVAWDPM